MFDLTFRLLGADDEALLWPLLMHAAHESSVAAVQRHPELTGYVAGWGRAGDVGWVAMEAGAVIGGAWVRLWPGEAQGYGHVDARIPELVFAVLPDYRGRGVGTGLLTRLMTTAEGHFPGISLSVRSDNPVIRLYERLGFVQVEGRELANRVGGQSFTMVYRYRPLEE